MPVATEKVVSGTKTEAKPVVNADSSIAEILVSRQEKSNSGETTSQKKDESDMSGDDVNTQTEDETEEELEDESQEDESEEDADKSTETVKSDEESADEGSEEEREKKSPIPYERFSKKVKQYNELKQQQEQLKVQLDDVLSVLQEPEVLELALQKKGYTDEEVGEYFTKNNLERKGKTLVKEKDEESTFDLNTSEGWEQKIKHIAQKIAEQIVSERIKPIEGKLTKVEQAELIKKNEDTIRQQETEAKTLAKEKYELDYGVYGEDESNLNTAIGKMSVYLDNNPGDAKLGYVKVLKLAMADEAIAKGVSKGVQKERKRQEDLKSLSMESNETFTHDELPDPNWSVPKLLAWRAKHNK